LSFVAGALTCAIWRAGLIDSLQTAFVVNVSRGEAPSQSPQDAPVRGDLSGSSVLDSS
jgi:hypothetical protein